MEPIVDLHCDLLSFLAQDPLNTVDNPRSKGSYPQMRKGGVALQILPIFTETGPDSFTKGTKQVAVLQRLLIEEPKKYRLFRQGEDWNPSETVAVLPSFENGSGFCSETMHLDEGFAFLETVLETFGRIMYIGLTWDGENRFGGGNGSKTGLKEDGKRLIEWMAGKKIAIDFSHTSDFLADDIFNHLDRKSLSVPVLASHSNVRSVTDVERNMPDFLLKELIARKGLIGLNLFAPFVGERADLLLHHAEKIVEAGGGDRIAFGADFFPDLFSSYVQKKYGTEVSFFPELPDASCYQTALRFLHPLFESGECCAEKIASGNFRNYLEKSIPS